MAPIRRKRSSRRPRASVQDIYNKGCVHGGYCPDDVRNKVEGTTLADKLLQWLGSIIYLGNLGIGTGKGTGGATGYNPVAGVTGPKVTSEVTISRPTIPVDPLGGVQGIPLDVIEPTSSAVVPLSEGLPTDIIIDTVTQPDLGPAEIDITTHSAPSIPSSESHPTIIGDSSGSVITDIQPGPAGPPRIALDVGTGANNAVQLNIVPQTGISLESNVFVDPHVAGETVTWGDEIPLQPLRNVEEFEIVDQDPPSTSSPIDTFAEVFRRATSRARDLYNRYVEQVPTRNINLLGRPSEAVQFEFENPAFTEDVTQIFERDLATVAAAPDPDFQDIYTIGRARYSETPEGTIRVSRLGQRASMQTRSGLHVGRRVHFYYDISPISQAEPIVPEDTIELRPLGSFSGDNVFINQQAESSFIDTAASGYAFDDEALLDPLEESFERSQVVLHYTFQDETMDVPTIPPGFGLKVYIPSLAENISVFYPSSYGTEATEVVDPNMPFSALHPSASLFVFGDSFYLPPPLLKRKRKQWPLF